MTNLHRSDNMEDMATYCPTEECSDCTNPFCEKLWSVYEGCNCHDCKYVRRRVREYKRRKERSGWMVLKKLEEKEDK